MTASTHLKDDDINHSLNQALITLCANPDFQRLDDELKVFNPFRVLKVERYELRHTTTLAWLLNPQGSHGMGDVFLGCLLRQFAKADEFWATAEMETAEVLAELVFDENRGFLHSTADDAVDAPTPSGDRLDVLIEGRNLRDGKKWCVAIEAKIDSKEGDQQLVGYDKWLKPSFGEHQLLKLYLTVGPVLCASTEDDDDTLPQTASTKALSSSEWTNIFWGEHIAQALAESLEQLERQDKQLKQQVSEFIGHYQKLLASLSNKTTTDFEHQVHAFANGREVSAVLRALKQQIDAKPASARHWDVERNVPAYWRHRAMLDRCVAAVRSAESAFIWDHVLNGIAGKPEWHILTPVTSKHAQVAFVPACWLGIDSLRNRDDEWNFYYLAEFRNFPKQNVFDVELTLRVPESGDRSVQLAMLKRLFPNEDLTSSPACFSPQARSLRRFIAAEAGQQPSKWMKLHSVSLNWQPGADGAYRPAKEQPPVKQQKFLAFWSTAEEQINAIAAVAQAHPTPQP